MNVNTAQAIAFKNLSTAVAGLNGCVRACRLQGLQIRLMVVEQVEKGVVSPAVMVEAKKS